MYYIYGRVRAIPTYRVYRLYDNIFSLTLADYESKSELLTFSPTVDVNEVVVNIINDDIREDTETFFGSIDGQDQPVITNPDSVVIRIIHNDCKLSII